MIDCPTLEGDIVPDINRCKNKMDLLLQYPEVQKLITEELAKALEELTAKLKRYIEQNDSADRRLLREERYDAIRELRQLDPKLCQMPKVSEMSDRILAKPFMSLAANQPPLV